MVIRKVLRSSYRLEQKLESTVEKLLAFNSAIDSIGRTVNPELRYFYLALRDQFNKTQIFDVFKAHSNYLLPGKYSRIGVEPEKSLLVSLMADLRYEGYQYQFVRAQFYSAIVEHYYLKDVENALATNDPAVLQEYRRFKQKGILYSIFPSLGTLIRVFIFPKVSKAALFDINCSLGDYEHDYFLLHDRKLLEYFWSFCFPPQ